MMQVQVVQCLPHHLGKLRVSTPLFMREKLIQNYEQELQTRNRQEFKLQAQRVRSLLPSEIKVLIKRRLIRLGVLAGRAQINSGL